MYPLLKEFTDTEEMHKAVDLNLPTHPARCIYNPKIIHLQCHYCGKFLTMRRLDLVRILKHGGLNFHIFCSSPCKHAYRSLYRYTHFMGKNYERHRKWYFNYMSKHNSYFPQY